MAVAALLALLAALGLVAQSVRAQFVLAPTDLNKTTGHLDISVRYKQVPDGICETTPGVQSFSGYVDIEEKEHIFFWFFEARNVDPTTAPLTVWINGGPGSSSMIGLFQELGPCGVDYNGDLYSNPYAWNNASNLLFVDEPAGTGFSYSDAVPGYVSAYGDVIQLPNTTCPDYAADSGCGTYSYANMLATANSTQSAAPRFWKTLQGFTGAFPQYASGDLHFTTESYGGHYGPIFSEYIQTQNAAIRNGSLPGAHELRLKSVLIGNGWYDPLIQYAAYYNFTVFPGNTYDYSPYDEATQLATYNAMYGPGNCYDMTKSCHETGVNELCSFADTFCHHEVENPLGKVGRDEYDIRYLTHDPFPYVFYVDYLNTPKVQSAIGAFVNFSVSSSCVSSAFGSTGDGDRESGTIEAVRKLASQGVYVVSYAGDADYNCNWLGGEAVAKEIDAPGFSSAGYTNITTSDGIVHGQVKQSGNYAFARVYYSGHEVPFYQPLLSLELLTRVIAGKDVATGESTVGSGNYTSVGTARSTFREGNATVQFGVVPSSATYNTTDSAPDPFSSIDKTTTGVGTRRSAARSGRTGAERSRKLGLGARSSLMGQNRRWA